MRYYEINNADKANPRYRCEKHVNVQPGETCRVIEHDADLDAIDKDSIGTFCDHCWAPLDSVEDYPRVVTEASGAEHITKMIGAFRAITMHLRPTCWYSAGSNPDGGFFLVKHNGNAIVQRQQFDTLDELMADMPIGEWSVPARAGNLTLGNF